MMRPTRLMIATVAATLLAGAGGPLQAQNPPKAAASPVERLGTNRIRVGTITVDSARREVSVAATFTGVSALEFIAVARKGIKAYESLLELDTTAIDFNVALILVGLDPSHGVVPRMHFDPNPPKGDAVEIWVEWMEDGKPRRVRGEQLIYNEITKQVMSEGPWVYTGSAFSAENNAYLAEVEGTLIGFVHTPAPVIENPRPIPESAYGNNILNPAFKIPAGTTATLTVRALGAAK